MSEANRSPTREENREAVRQRLLDAALRLFNEKGYAATPVREIVEAAGVTKPVLYYYFKSKEGIFQAIMDRAREVYTREMEEALAFRGTCRERLLHLCDTLYGLFVRHIEVPRLLFSVHFNPEREAPAFDFEAFPRALENAIFPLLREGVESGEIRRAPLPHLMFAIFGVVHIAMLEQLNACCKTPRMARHDLAPVLDLVFSGIAADNGKKETP
jgi:TetR/AcrR family transcriptional regulator